MAESRPNPDLILAQIKREEDEKRHGRLRIYLGAFPGVGKTFAMLNEGQRRRKYGEDVVVGFVETHGRAQTKAQLEGLELVPRKPIDYRGVVLYEMDTDAIIRRRPAVALVDELAHTNAAGSDRQKRYEDVQALMATGIDVVSTLNVQHLESLNDTVEALTGVRVRETIPDSVLDEADEVILIDLSPEGARARMAHGHIYPPEQAKQALQSFFKPENLAALRELALRRTAEEVDTRLDEYMRDAARPADAEEHVLVFIDETAAARTLIRHGWRLAQGLNADLTIAYLKKTDLSEAQERELARTLELAEDLNGSIRPLEAVDAGKALPAFLQAEGINHVVLQHRAPKLGERLLGHSLPDQLAGVVPNLEVHLVSA